MAAETTWPVLSMRERRILGVLVEKAKTTPESYPMSLNALVTGCNQKSNRDPLMTLDDIDVEEALEAMMPRGLVIKVTGGRVDRWRHALYDAWAVNKVELAVLAELLLRGPQSLGDLRGRASRMEPIETLEALRDILKPLVERTLVVWLTPENRRGAMLTHGFHAPEELERLKGFHSAGSAEEQPPVRAAAPAASGSAISEDRAKLTEALAEIERLRAGLGELRDEVTRLAAVVTALQRELGVNPPG